MMQHTGRRSTAWLAVWLFCLAVPSLAQQPPATPGVLLLLSYEPLYPAAQLLIGHLGDAFSQHPGQPVNLQVEFMSADLGTPPRYRQDYATLLRQKQQDGARYDVVIAVGDSALQLVADERQGLLASTPVVTLNATDPELINELAVTGQLTGIADSAPVYEFLAFSRYVFPGARSLHVITDELPGREQRMRQIRLASNSLGLPLQVHSLAKLSWDELARQLRGIRNEPVLLLSAYRDRLQQPRRFSDAVDFISQNSGSPVWHLWQAGIGTGLSGGVVTDLRATAFQTADITLRILSGTAASDIPVLWQPPQITLVDETQISRFGLRRAQFPPETRFINELASFWRSYSVTLVLVICAILLLLTLGFLIWTENRRRHLSDEQLHERTALMGNILDAIPDLLFYKDTEGRYVLCNRAFIRTVGRNPIGRKDEDLFDRDLAATLRQQDTDILIGRGTGAYETWIQGRGNRTLLLETHKNPITNERGQVVGIFGVGRDITDLKKAQQNLEHIAHHDTLTGLPNRLLLNKKMEYAINLARRAQHSLGVIYLDLDRFKDINDTIGHDIGDLLLKDVAHRLHHNVRESDICSRLGGDEFILVITQIQDYATLQEKCEQLLQLVSRPYSLQGHLLSVFASAGLSLFPQDGDCVDELIRNADAALHKAKELGRNRCYRYERELTDSIHSRMTLEQDLRSALEMRQFTLVFQPQFRLGDPLPQRAEALLRWPHPTRGMISPLDFIPLAETSGMISELGYWVLRNACQQFLFWREQGLQLTCIAVNVSPVQIDSRFAATVADILQSLSFDPHWLELEVTESLMMSGTTEVNEQITALRALGVEFAIDDFGTGYSSLSKLKSMPVSVLKIDQSFVRDINDDANDYEIARAIILMARSLGLTVIAEGVETPQQEQTLQHLGCEWMQGYYYARPMSADDFYQHYRTLADA